MRKNLLVFASAALFFAPSTGAVTLKTNATAWADMCCLPSGASITMVEFIFTFEVIDAASSIGLDLVYGYHGNDRCDFGGATLAQNSGAMTLTQPSVRITERLTNRNVRCPFGARGKAQAQLLNDFLPLLSVEDFSECAQPCFSCQSPPFLE